MKHRPQGKATMRHINEARGEQVRRCTDGGDVRQEGKWRDEGYQT